MKGNFLLVPLCSRKEGKKKRKIKKKKEKKREEKRNGIMLRGEKKVHLISSVFPQGGGETSI